MGKKRKPEESFPKTVSAYFKFRSKCKGDWEEWQPLVISNNPGPGHSPYLRGDLAVPPFFANSQPLKVVEIRKRKMWVTAPWLKTSKEKPRRRGGRQPIAINSINSINSISWATVLPVRTSFNLQNHSLRQWLSHCTDEENDPPVGCVICLKGAHYNELHNSFVEWIIEWMNQLRIFHESENYQNYQDL